MSTSVIQTLAGGKNKDPVFSLPPEINTTQCRFPFCIVWAPIPLLSWIFPFIGHVGICDSEGKIYDFQGDFHVGTDRMLFGYPVKYWDISSIYVPSFYNPQNSFDRDGVKIQDEINAYNSAISLTKAHFNNMEHYNFFTNNCHSFVAACLNKETTRRRNENMLTICIGMFLYGNYTSVFACISVFAPLIIVTIVVVVLVVLQCTA